MVCNWNLGPCILGFLPVALLFIFFQHGFPALGFLGCVVRFPRVCCACVVCVVHLVLVLSEMCVVHLVLFLTNDTPIPLRSRKRYLIFYFLMYCPFQHMLNAFEIYNHVFHAVACIYSILKVTSLHVYSGHTGAW